MFLFLIVSPCSLINMQEVQENARLCASVFSRNGIRAASIKEEIRTCPLTYTWRNVSSSAETGTSGVCGAMRRL